MARHHDNAVNTRPWSLRILPLFIAFDLLLAASAANAQYDGGGSFAMGQFYGQQAMSRSILDGINRNHRASERANRAARGEVEERRSEPVRISRHSSPADFAIADDPEVSAAVKRQYLDGVRARSGERVAANIERAFDYKDVRTAFAESATPYGLRTDDYADVFAAYLVVMWMTANQVDAPAASDVRAVSDQTHGIFAPSARQWTSRQRQMQAEGMMYEIVSALYARQSAQRVGDTATLQKMAAAAQRNFLKNGLNLQAMMIDGSGLVRR